MTVMNMKPTGRFKLYSIYHFSLCVVLGYAECFCYSFRMNLSLSLCRNFRLILNRVFVLFRDESNTHPVPNSVPVAQYPALSVQNINNLYVRGYPAHWNDIFQ